MRTRRATTSSVGLCVLLCAAAALAPGCSKKEGVLQLPAENSAAVRTTRTSKPRPPADLTLEQGRKLVKQVRANPSLVNKLSMKERRFLAKAIAATDEDEDEN